MSRKLKPDFRNARSGYFSQGLRAGYMIRGEIWLEKNGRLYINSQRMNLLKLIDEFGSLAAAARTMGLGYNTAWLWVMAMNRLSPAPLVEKGPGGVNGGYSALTDHGYQVIAEYNKLNCTLKDTIQESKDTVFITNSK
jgi:molybdate transport system regulatory protein